MARACVCGDHFVINDEGELCLKGGTTGLREVVIFRQPGIHQFVKGDYPWLARVRVRVQGAGGGSGGADSDPGELIARPGGTGGGYSESMLDAAMLGAVETVVVGAGGAGGTGNQPGDNGGNSAFGGLVTANGGIGGTANMNSGTSATTSNGVAGPIGGTGDFAAGGGGSRGAIRLHGTAGMSGNGGDSMLGTGGYGRTTNGDGTPPRGWGAGAGGAFSQGGPAHNGASGSNGMVIVELYA